MPLRCTKDTCQGVLRVVKTEKTQLPLARLKMCSICGNPSSTMEVTKVYYERAEAALKAVYTAVPLQQHMDVASVQPSTGDDDWEPPLCDEWGYEIDPSTGERV